MLAGMRERAAAILGVVVLAGCTAAQASVDSKVPGVFYLGSGRIAASTAALVGLAGAIIGGRSLARSTSRIGMGDPRRGALVALVAGLVATLLGGLVAASAPGGIGTGNGLGGAIVAVVLGVLSLVLGGLALARSRTD
jgi:hypothetical protein